MIGVVNTRKALEMARDVGLDLVEVSPNERPPVCKIMDYGKYKYLQKKKAHRSKKKQHVVHLKELRLRPKTEEHDVQIKINHAREFIENGDKVLVKVMFKGREMSHVEIGKEMLTHFAEELEDIAKVEKEATVQHRNMTIILAPQ